MAARVSEPEVQAIIDTVVDSLAPFITAANTMVNGVLLNRGLTDEELKQIELWLAAHFVAIRDPRLSSESMGAASQSFAIQVALGLDQTTYGQQAKILDRTGTLANMGKRRASFTVLT